MIVKGGARAGAGNLAAHLEREDTNESVSIVAIEGLAGTTIKEALAEIMAQTVGTQCRDGMYHAAISPRPGELDLTPEQRLRAVEVLADELGLTGQPHIVVEHQKIGASGIERTHTHVVFSRVDEDGKTISDFNNYPAHERAARRLEIELGHEPTPGAWNREEGTPRPTRSPHPAEYQQAERSKVDPKAAERILSELWQQSDSGKGFVAAAAEQGFAVCQGDSCLLVVDPGGAHVRLTRRLPDRAADIIARMAGVELPTLGEVLEAKSHEQAAPAPEITQGGAEAASAMEVAAGSEQLSPAPPDAAGYATPDAGMVEPTLNAGDALETAGHAVPHVANDELQQDATPSHSAEPGSRADAFTDKKPSFAVEESLTDSMDKAASAMTSAGGKVVSAITGAVSKALEGLFDFFFGGGAEAPPKSPPSARAPQQVQQWQTQQTQQRAAPAIEAPKVQPVQQAQRQPQARPEWIMASLLKPDELAKLEATRADRTKLNDLPRPMNRERDFGR